MKTDTAFKEFLEKYDNNAIMSIDVLSNNFARNAQFKKISLYNMKECFESFCDFLNGYAQYKVENINNPEASPQDAIQKSTQSFIESDILKSVDVPYRDIPDFVTGYIDGVKKLTETVETSKQMMIEANVDQDAIGDVNTFADKFMDRISESFDEGMNRLLWASGYKSNQILIERKGVAPKSNNEEPDPVFL